MPIPHKAHAAQHTFFVQQPPGLSPSSETHYREASTKLIPLKHAKIVSYMIVLVIVHWLVMACSEHDDLGG